MTEPPTIEDMLLSPTDTPFGHKAQVQFGPGGIDLDGIMRQVMQRVALACAAAKRYPDGDLTFPAVTFEWRFGKVPIVSSEEARQDVQTWLIGVGLRDAIEALAKYAEDVRFMAFLLRTKESPFRVERDMTMGEAVRELKNTALRKFAKSGWPDRIKDLETTFGLHVDATHLLSIQKLRNCLTHRGGIVDETDVTDPDRDALVVTYIVWQLTRRDADGKNTDVNPGDHVPAGSWIGLRKMPKDLIFIRGKRIVINPNQFHSLMYTLWEFGESLREELMRYIQAMGSNTKESDTGERGG